MDVREMGNTRCLVVEVEDGPLATADAVVRLFGDAMGEEASAIVVPAECLDAAFFELRSGLAGEVLQKAANYRIRFAVVGDISEYVAASKAFHDLVVESGRATGCCFVPDMETLGARWAAVAG